MCILWTKTKIEVQHVENVFSFCLFAMPTCTSKHFSRPSHRCKTDVNSMKSNSESEEVDRRCLEDFYSSDDAVSIALFRVRSMSQDNPDDSYHETHIFHQHQSHCKKRKYSGLGRLRFGHSYHLVVAMSVLVYWTFVSVVPVYNKFFFQMTLYPYPIATAGIQLGVVSFLLATFNTLHHFLFEGHSRRHCHRCQQNSSKKKREQFLSLFKLYKVTERKIMRKDLYIHKQIGITDIIC